MRRKKRERNLPELPEVETIKIGLSKKLIGKKIVDIDVLNKKSFQGKLEDVLGSKIVGIERRAKLIRIILSNDLNLLFHLKLTGQLIVVDHGERFAGGHPSHDWHAKLPNSSTRIIFDFSDNIKLFFNDLRKFGWCKVLKSETIVRLFNEDFGVEPFDLRSGQASKEFNIEYLLTQAKRIPNRNIKQFLMDQKIIAGIGNIYADEILFESRVMPTRKIKDLKLSEWQKIHENIIKILKLGIKYGGTTDSDYVNALGKKGGMQDHLKVYHRTGKPCFGCKGMVKRMTIGGRGTHYCPICQK